MHSGNTTFLGFSLHMDLFDKLYLWSSKVAVWLATSKDGRSAGKGVLGKGIPYPLLFVLVDKGLHHIIEKCRDV